MQDLWPVHYQILSITCSIIHRIPFKFGHKGKKWETCGIKCNYCKCFLSYKKFKDHVRIQSTVYFH